MYSHIDIAFDALWYHQKVIKTTESRYQEIRRKYVEAYPHLERLKTRKAFAQFQPMIPQEERRGVWY